MQVENLPEETEKHWQNDLASSKTWKNFRGSLLI